MTVAVMTNKEWTALTARARPARMARRRALQDAGAARHNIDARLEMTQAVLKRAPPPNGSSVSRGEGVPCAPVAHPRRGYRPPAGGWPAASSLRATTRRPAACARPAPPPASPPPPSSATARQSLASTPPNYCRSSASPQPTSPPSPTNASSPQLILRPRTQRPWRGRSGVLPVNQMNRRPHQPAHRRVACVVARRLLLAFPEAEPWPARAEGEAMRDPPVNHKTHFLTTRSRRPAARRRRDRVPD